MKQFQWLYIHYVISETEISIQMNARFQTCAVYFRDDDTKYEYIFCFWLLESNFDGLSLYSAVNVCWTASNKDPKYT